MNKTIVVGIGGTGLDVIRALRRKVVETRGSLAAAPHLGFFYIDTDDKEIKLNEDNKKRWEILGTSVALSAGEYSIIPPPDFGELAANLAAYTNVRSWLPMEQLKVLDQTDKQAAGARQIRALGRLGFTLAADKIEREMKAHLAHITAPADGGETQVFIVCSLSGGTGSGIFLDLAYRMKSWVTENHHTHGFLVFPDLGLKRDERYVPNAYAALKELNYYSLSGSRPKGVTERIGFRLPGATDPVYSKPFDFCYVVGTRNAENVKISLSGVAEMIAHRLFLSFDSSFAEDARTLLNNGGAERAIAFTDEITGNLHSRNFFTFGLSAIEYPTQQIKEIIAWRMAGTLFGGWIAQRDVPGNLNEMVRNLAPQLKISDDYLFADRYIFADGGANLNFDQYGVQVRNEVEQIIANAPESNQAEHFGEKVKGFLSGYRNRGVVNFYQDRMGSHQGAVGEIMRQIRTRVNDFIQIPTCGYEYAVRWLDEVVRYCNDRHAKISHDLEGETIRLKNSPETLERGYADLSVAEGKWFFRDDSLRQSRDVVRETLALYLTSYVSTQAMPYALRVLDGVLQQTRNLSNELKDWRLTLDKVTEEVAKEQERRATFLKMRVDGDSDFNGSILFEDSLVNTNYKALDLEAALRFVTDKLQGRQDVLKLVADPATRTAAREEAYRLALQWMEQESRVLLSEKSVADQLLEELPDNRETERRALLQTNRKRSTPFLPFDLMEMNKFGGTTPIASRHVALMGDENGTYPNVLKVQADLRAIGYPRENVKVIVAKNQILFLQEETAFTLRAIAELKTVKNRYQDYLADAGKPNSSGVPLHLQKSYNPPLMDLLLPDVETYHGAEEDFLAGWIDSKIRFEVNQTDQVEEIRYRYEEHGSSQWITLGRTWESALEHWMREGRDAEGQRQLLRDDNARMWKQLTSQPRKLEYASKLSGHLETLKGRYENGEESPVYKQWDSIRRRMMDRHGLPVPPPAPPPPRVETHGSNGASPTKAPQDDLATVAKFRKMVDLAVKTGKGSLTPSFAQSLEMQRKSIGLSEGGAKQAIQESLAAFGQPHPLEAYRQTYVQFLAGGVGEDERNFLTQMILDQGLDPDAAERIEKEERVRAGAA